VSPGGSLNRLQASVEAPRRLASRLDASDDLTSPHVRTVGRRDAPVLYHETAGCIGSGRLPTAGGSPPDPRKATGVPARQRGFHAMLSGIGGTWGHETPRPCAPGRFVPADWGVSTRRSQSSAGNVEMNGEHIRRISPASPPAMIRLAVSLPSVLKPYSQSS
jgi:hypothetical protein